MQDDRCNGDKHMHNKISNYTTNNIYYINTKIPIYIIIKVGIIVVLNCYLYCV